MRNTTNTPGATPRPYSTTPVFSRIPPSERGTKVVANSEGLTAGPCMPGTSGTKPTALANDVISTIVFVPSTNDASIFGFMFCSAAAAATDSGVAVRSSGLFFPLPAQITSKPREAAKSYSSIVAPGSSPEVSV